MLKIQEFIFEHENWRELLAAPPYSLKISEDEGFVLFKYDQIKSDFSEQICCEARGLILDSTQNFKVVRLAFYKFFNLGEPFAAQIDWTTAISNEKIDGSLMSVWFARGKWHLSTNGVINAFKAPIAGVGPYKNFGELFESVLPLSIFEHYNKHRCWTFELVSPYTKVVIDYSKTQVYLLSIRDMDSLNELGPDVVEMLADANGFAFPQCYNFNNEADYRKFVGQMSEGHEGIVIRDAFNNRVKLKTPLYFELHRMAGNGILTAERALHLVRTNEIDEFLVYFPEYKDYLTSVQSFYNEIKLTLVKVELEVEKLKSLPRKEFAEIAKSKPYPFLYFKAYDNQDLKTYIEKLADSSFLKMFKYKGSEK